MSFNLRPREMDVGVTSLLYGAGFFVACLWGRGRGREWRSSKFTVYTANLCHRQLSLGRLYAGEFLFPAALQHTSLGCLEKVSPVVTVWLCVATYLYGHKSRWCNSDLWEILGNKDCWSNFKILEENCTHAHTESTMVGTSRGERVLQPSKQLIILGIAYKHVRVIFVGII